MNKLKVLFALLLLTCAAGASAQDVIVKKDGSTVVCRVVEVSASEIVYKKWTDLNGSNYVMNCADASVINYENGTRSEINGTTETPMPPSATTPPTSTSRNVAASIVEQRNPYQQSKDIKLMAMDYELQRKLRAAKVLKRIGWIGGGVLIAGGIALDIVGANKGGDEWYYSSTDYHFESDGSKQLLLGNLAIGTGVILGTTCVIIGTKKERRIINELQYSSLWQEEIPLRNGTSLLAGIDVMRDRKANAIGLGLRYNF